MLPITLERKVSMSNSSMCQYNSSLTLLEADWQLELSRYTTANITFESHEKAIFTIEWVLIQFVGNPLLWGMIQFDRFGSDPLKRRIIDQVV